MDERSQQKNKPSYYKGLGKKTRSAREKHFKRQSSMHWDDPDAYKSAPGDDKPTKDSKWNKKFKDMYGEGFIDESDLENDVEFMFEMLELTEEIESLTEAINEALNAKTRKALRNKAKKARAPMGALTSVYKKGLAAWRTGHRPGASQHAWAMARVNSFLAGGPARKVDAAQWKRVRKHRRKGTKKRRG